MIYIQDLFDLITVGSDYSDIQIPHKNSKELEDMNDAMLCY